MKTWNIIYRDPKDTTTIIEDPAEGYLYIPLDGTLTIAENVFKHLHDNGLLPQSGSTDFLKLALSVYGADQLIARNAAGYYNWSRHFRLFLPVADLRSWSNIKIDVERLLSFLSGDKWEIVFRQSSYSFTTTKRATEINAVCLLSGGLDSYIGSRQLLTDGYNVALVGHHKTGSGEKGSQEEIFNLFKTEYSKSLIEYHSFFVQPQQKHSKATKEPSSRARSIIFLALGIAVANSIDEKIPLFVPENGFISLNIPLSLTRLGSLSTRTTHPNVFHLLKRVLHGIGVHNTVVNPYQFLTKGEMIDQSPSRDIIVKTNTLTMSCAHPDVARWHGRSPGTHCGYCTPCIIRRAALNVVGADRGSEYVIDIKTQAPGPDEDSGSDLRAFKLALENNSSLTKGDFLRVLSSGPLHLENEKQLSEYYRVYQQGLSEVRNMLGL